MPGSAVQVRSPLPSRSVATSWGHFPRARQADLRAAVRVHCGASDPVSRRSANATTRASISETIRPSCRASARHPLDRRVRGSGKQRAATAPGGSPTGFVAFRQQSFPSAVVTMQRCSCFDRWSAFGRRSTLMRWSRGLHSHRSADPRGLVRGMHDQSDRCRECHAEGLARPWRRQRVRRARGAILGRGLAMALDGGLHLGSGRGVVAGCRRRRTGYGADQRAERRILPHREQRLRDRCFLCRRPETRRRCP